MEVHIKGKKVGKASVTLSIRVAAGELVELKRGAYTVVAQRNGIDVTGEGSLAEIVEGALGPMRADSLMVETLENFVAPFALSEDGGDYSVVGAPEFEPDERYDGNGDFLFTATWARLPEMELASYEPVEVTVPVAKVGEAEVEARLREVAESFKTIERDPTCEVAEDGSIALISMECERDGDRFDSLCFENRPYRVGSGQMPTGFDEALLGAHVGDTVHVDFLLPVREGVDGTMTGPSITGEVTVEAIMREVVRELDDDFVAENMPGLDDMDDLREQCRSELVRGKEEELRHYRNYLAADALSERLVGSIDDGAYDAVSRQMMQQLGEQAHAEHVSVEELLKSRGTTEEQYRMMTLVQARGQLRQSAALDAWARHRGLEVTDDDIEAFYASSGQGEKQNAAMRGEIEKGGYGYLAREGALRLKASEDLVAHAIVHEDASLEMPLVA